jgi:hemolysin activation/secretion protein
MPNAAQLGIFAVTLLVCLAMGAGRVVMAGEQELSGISTQAIAIKSLRLIPNVNGDIRVAGDIDTSQIQPPQPLALVEKLKMFLGKPINDEILKNIRETISSHFTELGRPFVDVGLPPQDVTEGDLSIVVAEFQIGSIRTKGNEWFSSEMIENFAQLKSGSIIDKVALDERLTKLNENPFLKVAPEFTPGTKPGTTDVTLQAEDRLPVDVTASYSTTGNPTTGWERFSHGASWGNAFGRGQTLSYQLGTSASVWQGLARDLLRSKDPTFLGHTISWSAPLASGDALQASFGYSRSVPLLGPDLGSVAITVNAGGQYQTHLSETDQISFGVDYKRSNNQLAFGGTTVQHGYTEVMQFTVHNNSTFNWMLGEFSVDNTLTVSPGGLTSGNRNSAFMPPADGTHSGSPGTYAKYLYDKLTLTQTIPLSESLTLALKASGQEATSNLLGSESFSIAGADAVRGYAEFGLSGARGLLFSAELRGPSWPILLPDDNLQLHAFVDEGQAWNPTASASTPAYSHSLSFGVGSKYMVGRYLTLGLDQGWQILRSSRQPAGGAFLHVSINATW